MMNYECAVGWGYIYIQLINEKQFQSFDQFTLNTRNSILLNLISWVRTKKNDTTGNSDRLNVVQVVRHVSAAKLTACSSVSLLVLRHENLHEYKSISLQV